MTTDVVRHDDVDTDGIIQGAPLSELESICGNCPLNADANTKEFDEVDGDPMKEFEVDDVDAIDILLAVCGGMSIVRVSFPRMRRNRFFCGVSCRTGLTQLFLWLLLQYEDDSDITYFLCSRRRWSFCLCRFFRFGGVCGS